MNKNHQQSSRITNAANQQPTANLQQPLSATNNYSKDNQQSLTTLHTTNIPQSAINSKKCLCK